MNVPTFQKIYEQKFQDFPFLFSSRYPNLFYKILSSWESPIEMNFLFDRITKEIRFSMPAEIVFELDNIKSIYLNELGVRQKKAPDAFLSKLSSHLVPEIMVNLKPLDGPLINQLKTMSSFIQNDDPVGGLDFLNQIGMPINQKDLEGLTFLMHCVMRGSEKMAVALLKNGCNPHMQDSQGNTALHWAIINNNLRMAEMLMFFGASTNTPNFNGTTPYILANIKQDSLFAQRLYDYNGNPFEQDKQGNTCLHKAITAKALSNVRLLLILNCSLNTRNLKGITPYDLAKQDRSAMQVIENLEVEKRTPLMQWR